MTATWPSTTTTSAATTCRSSAASWRPTTCGAASTAASTRSTRRDCPCCCSRRTPRSATPASIAALLIGSAWGAALLWRLVRDVTADAGAAWFAWAAAVLASPILFHAFTVFPDGVAGIAALVGVRGLAEMAGARRDRDPSAPASWTTLVTSGAALAVLPWLHTRAAVIAAALGLAIVATAIWRRTPWPRLAAFAIVPMLSAAGWFGYFLRVYGTLDPSAPYGGYTQTAWAHVPAGLAGLLLDAQFGVLGVAPVFALALVGLAWMAAWRLVRRPRGDWLDGRGPHRRRSRSSPPSWATPSPRRRTGCGGAAPARRRASWCRCCCRWRSRSASRGAGPARRRRGDSRAGHRRAPRHGRGDADPRRRRRRAARLRQPHGGGWLDAVGEPGGRSRARAAGDPPEHAGRGGGPRRRVGGRGGPRVGGDRRGRPRRRPSPGRGRSPA